MNNPVSIVGTLQMYLTDSSKLLAKEEELANKNGYRLGLKLVRGAYIHSEKIDQLLFIKLNKILIITIIMVLLIVLIQF